MKITRRLYCHDCFKAHRPHNGELYVFHGAQGLVFDKIKTFDHHSYGYTPHLIELTENIGHNVIYTKLCGMNGCGIQIIDDGEDDFLLTDEYGNPVVKDKGKFWHYLNNDIVEYKGKVYYSFEVKKQPILCTATLEDWNGLINLELE